MYKVSGTLPATVVSIFSEYAVPQESGSSVATVIKESLFDSTLSSNSPVCSSLTAFSPLPQTTIKATAASTANVMAGISHFGRLGGLFPLVFRPLSPPMKMTSSSRTLS